MGWEVDLGPHEEESQEDVVETTLNARFLCTPMPAQVAAVEAAASPPRPPPTPDPPPPSTLPRRAHNEETVSARRGEIRITMWLMMFVPLKAQSRY